MYTTEKTQSPPLTNLPRTGTINHSKTRVCDLATGNVVATHFEPHVARIRTQLKARRLLWPHKHAVLTRAGKVRKTHQGFLKACSFGLNGY